MTTIALLETQARALFRITPAGRIERENDPDCSAGPRLWLAGCKAGTTGRVRTDVAEGPAAELAALFATEPPFVDPEGLPRHLDRYVALLGQGGAAPEPGFGLTWHLPHGLAGPAGIMLVGSDDDAGRQLAAGLAADGIPAPWVELGFRDVSDLWAPWCAVLQGGEIASLAFAARLSDDGAELGLVTAPGFRGRGLGAAATAGWSRLPSLAGRTLFYSTSRANISSQRVVARLGLDYVGASLRLT